MTTLQVWLLWDHRNAEKGEEPDLFDVYASHEAAVAAIRREYDAEVEPEDEVDLGEYAERFYVEMRAAKS